MEAVLLDAIRRSPPRRAFAAQPPPELINRDAIPPLKLGARQLEGGGDGRAPAADDGDLNRSFSCHSPRIAVRRAPDVNVDNAIGVFTPRRRGVASLRPLAKARGGGSAILKRYTREREREVGAVHARRRLEACLVIPAEDAARDGERRPACKCI